MTTTSKAPNRPGPVVLRRMTGGRLPSYITHDSRFTVSRNPAEPGVPFEDSGYDIVDTRRAGILGHLGDNRARVYELDDARGIIGRVLKIEYLYALQRHLDAERRDAGLPTIAEEAATRSRAQRLGVDA